MKAAVKVFELLAFYSSDMREFAALAEELGYIIVSVHNDKSCTAVIDAERVNEFKSLVSEVFACSYDLCEIY